MEILVTILFCGCVALILMAVVMFGLFMYDEIKERLS